MEPEQIDKMYRKAEKLAHEALTRGIPLETAIEKMGSAISLLEQTINSQGRNDQMLLELACYNADKLHMMMHLYADQSRYFNAHVATIDGINVLGSIMDILNESWCAPAAIRMRTLKGDFEDNLKYGNFLTDLENETDEASILRNKIDMAKHSLKHAVKRDDTDMVHTLAERIKKMQKDLIKFDISS